MKQKKIWILLCLILISYFTFFVNTGVKAEELVDTKRTIYQNIPENTFFYYEGYAFFPESYMNLTITLHNWNQTYYNFTLNCMAWDITYLVWVYINGSGFLNKENGFVPVWYSSNPTYPNLLNNSYIPLIVPTNLEYRDNFTAYALLQPIANTTFYTFRENKYEAPLLNREIPKTISAIAFDRTNLFINQMVIQKSTGICVYIQMVSTFMLGIVVSELWIAESNFSPLFQIELNVVIASIIFFSYGIAVAVLYFSIKKFLMAKS